MQLHNDGHTCRDIDECLGKDKIFCSVGKCVNTIGSFICETEISQGRLTGAQISPISFFTVNVVCAISACSAIVISLIAIFIVQSRSNARRNNAAPPVQYDAQSYDSIGSKLSSRSRSP